MEPKLRSGLRWRWTPSVWLVVAATASLAASGCAGEEEHPVEDAAQAVDVPDAPEMGGSDSAEVSQADTSVQPDVPLSDPEPGEPDAPPREISDLLLVESPANVLAYFVEWQTNWPEATHLTVDCGDEEPARVYESAALVTHHGVFVMGLYEGATCTLTAAADDLSAEATIDSVGPLPESLPELTVVTRDIRQMQPGWTLWNLSDASENNPIIIAVVDELGRYRWYYLHAMTAFPGAGNDTRTHGEGVLIGGRKGPPKPTWVSWEGEMLWQFELNAHHDMRPSPFHDNHLLYLQTTRENCPEETLEDTVNELDFETQETIWTWNICDHYVPETITENWSHVNTVEPFPDERAVLISVRDQNNLMRINRDTDELEWILGDYGDFELGEGVRFLRQHAPEIQPDGNIVLFDNGLDEEREYSRGIELALTFDADGQPDRVDLVWEYSDESLYADARGDADRLENGNTLLTYPNLASTGDSLLLEVTAAGEVAWEIRTPPNWSTYRSQRMNATYYGHVRPQPEE